MLPCKWLVPFGLCCRINMWTLGLLTLFHILSAEPLFYAVVHREVDCPCREVAQDRRSQSAIEPANAVVLEDRFESGWKRRVGTRTLSQPYGLLQGREDPSPTTPSYLSAPCACRWACSLVLMTSSGHVATLATRPPPAPAGSSGGVEVVEALRYLRQMVMTLTNHAICARWHASRLTKWYRTLLGGLQ